LQPIQYAESTQMADLLVAFGAERQHAAVPEGRCILCGGEIAGAQRIGSWHSGTSGGSWFRGECPACGIEHGAHRTRGAPFRWHLLAPGAEFLTTPLTTEEHEHLNRKLRRYPAIGLRWQNLALRRRPGDELWRYVEGDQSGVALVRNGVPVGCFEVPGDLLASRPGTEVRRSSVPGVSR
jgi:hypothetical protein